MPTIYVHTLGDSVLDNNHWMLQAGQSLENSVEGQLQSTLNPGAIKTYQVISHAYDGFKTSSVLNGDHAGRVLSILPGVPLTDMQIAYLKSKQIDPMASTFFVHPLNNFKTFVEQHAKDTHYVVINVAGNDFREQLGAPVEMLKQIPSIHERYLQILSEIKSLKGKDIRPIIMTQYRLDRHHDHYFIYKIMKVVGIIFATIHTFGALAILTSLSYALAFCVTLVAGEAKKIHFAVALAFILIGLVLSGLSNRIMPFEVFQKILKGQPLGLATLGGLMEAFYRPILAQAKADGIPVLDLSNTFNPDDSELYIAQIEPSQKGGKLIAEGIASIIKQHPFGTSPSIIYAKKETDKEFTGSENPGSSGWTVG